MKQTRHAIPMGVQDALGVECANMKRLESGLRDFFLTCGFQEISTPGIEFMEVFCGDVGRIDVEKMFKFTDSKGRLLALRPDNTLPIVRAVATYYKDVMLPVRLFYLQSAYLQGGGAWENPQAGLEMLGDASPYADAEIIASAIQALRNTGLEDFQIDIGQVGFFKGLMEEAGLDKPVIDILRGYVDTKNSLAIEMLLKESGELSPALQRHIMALPMLYGENAIAQARRMTNYPSCLEALENLEKVLSLLEDWGLREYCAVDLGMVHSVHYYSGIIFRGLVPGVGQPVLSGGRYDDLAREFDRDLPATGCALYLRQVMLGLVRQEKLRPLKPLYAVVGYAEGQHGGALQLAMTLRGEDKRVEILHSLKNDDVKLAMEKRGAQHWYFIDKNGKRLGGANE